MAMGPSHASVIRLILADILRMVAAGMAIGLPCAYACGKLIASIFRGVTPADPTASAARAAILIATALLAGYLPARKAGRVDPMMSLRAE
jgi:ABC-type lipoprotein release transport system permease subunit